MREGIEVTRKMEQLHRLSGGNPLFIKHMRLLCVQRGEVSRDDEGWLGKINLSKVPGTLEEIVLERVKCLDGDDRMVLEILAAHNKPMDLPLLVAVTNRPEDELMECLDRLFWSDMVEFDEHENGEQCFSPSHGIVQETVYDSLDDKEKNRLHRSIAGAMLDPVKCRRGNAA